MHQIYDETKSFELSRHTGSYDLKGNVIDIFLFSGQNVKMRQFKHQLLVDHQGHDI